MPSPRRALLLPAAASAALALAGCAATDDGPMTAERRAVPAFERIESSHSVDVRVRVGEPARLRVRAGEKVIDDVGTEVRDGTLHVTFDRDGIGPAEVLVDASTPALSGVETSGSGDLRAEGVDGASFSVRSDSSADIAVAGAVERLDVGLDGSGDADLRALAAREARVELGGSGGADVDVAERLEVSIDGSGDVRYAGDPVLEHRSDGSGELRRAGG